MAVQAATTTMICWISGALACLGAVVLALVNGGTAWGSAGLLIVGVALLVAAIFRDRGSAEQEVESPVEPAASEGGPSLTSRMEQFLEEVVRPTFEEIASEVREQGKEAKIIEGLEVEGAEAEILAAMHPRGVTLDRFQWGSTAPADGYLGYTLLVRDPEMQEEAHPQLGTYANSVMLRVAGADRVLASPLVMYYLKASGQYHIFARRYQSEEAHRTIGSIQPATLRTQFERSFARFQEEAPREGEEPE